MITFLSGNEHWPALLVNHLWQSTIVAALALLLTLALKKNRARVRYWVWMVASAKFLLPFTFLINAGQWLRSLIAVPFVKPSVTSAIELATQPFQATSSFDVVNVPASVHHSESLPLLLLSTWICGTLIIAVRWVRAWMNIRAIVGAATPTTISAEMPVLSSASLMEPGVFGIFRPVLLLPDGILERLQSATARDRGTRDVPCAAERQSHICASHAYTGYVLVPSADVVDWYAADRRARTGMR